MFTDWDLFATGGSIFVPCINTHAAVRDIRRCTGLRAFELEWRVGIEDGLYGVRVWKIDPIVV